MSDTDLAAIRARADADDADWYAVARTDVPALLALVDAQAARIDKALALHKKVPKWAGRADVFACMHDEANWPCPTVRALTEDTQ